MDKGTNDEFFPELQIVIVEVEPVSSENIIIEQILNNPFAFALPKPKGMIS